MTAQAFANVDLLHNNISAAKVSTGWLQSISTGDLDSYQTEELVLLYGAVNPTSKLAGKLREGIRNELLVRVNQGQGTENTKGAKLLDAGDVKLEFRPRVSTTFLPETAKEILLAEGLYDECLDTETIVKEPVALFEMLEKVQETLVQLGEVALAQDIETVFAMTTEKRVKLSEDKIEGLVKLDKLDVSDVQPMYDIKTTYSLYER